MANLQIKNLPESLHAELRRRAEQAGTTVRDYVLALIRRDQALPSKTDWLAGLRELTAVRLAKPAADYVAEVREDRGDDADRR